MSRVAVSPAILHWALDRAGQTLLGLEDRFPRISQWATGASQPTLKQLEALAKATLTPLGYFFLDAPPLEKLPIPHFRTLQNERRTRPSANLIATVQLMQRRQSWMREFLIEDGQDRLSLVRSAQLGETATSVGAKMQAAIGLPDGWASQQPTWTEALRVLRDAIERAGILLVVNGIVGNNTTRKLDPSEFRGFVLVDDFAPLLFVNGADGKAAQMFTLAHELAHVFFGSSAAFDLREMQPAMDATEQACNKAAAEFLIPERSLRQIWPSIRDHSERFQELARRFKVSELVAVRRALDLALINRQAFLSFYNDYQQQEHVAASRRSGGGDFYNNQNLRVGRRFASTVVRAAREGKLLYSEAYHLIGLYGATFDNYVSSLETGGLP